MASKTTTRPQAHRASQAITPVMQQFIKYIEAETGYTVDPMSVQLGSLMRAEFQKSPARQSARVKPAPKKVTTPKSVVKTPAKATVNPVSA